MILHTTFLDSELATNMTESAETPCDKTEITRLPLSQKLSQRLSDFDLSVRTSNCMYRENITYIGDLVSLSEMRLMRISNFGRKSLRELQQLLESLGLHLGMALNNWSPNDVDLNSAATAQGELALETNDNEPFTELSDAEIAHQYVTMGLLKRVDLLGLSVRAANCLKNLGIVYIGDLATKNENWLLRTPNFGRTSLAELNAALGKIGLHFGMDLPHWPLKDLERLVAEHDLETAEHYAENLKDSFYRTIGKISSPHHLRIINARFGLTERPRTLEYVAKELGITRERVRQIQKKITQSILSSEFWDDVLRIKLRKLMEGRSAPLFLDTLEQEDAWFSGFSENLILLENILLAFSEMEKLCFLNHQGRKIITQVSPEEWRGIKYDLVNMLEHSLDAGLTMDDVEMLVESKASATGAPELSSLLFEQISEDLNFAPINGDLVLVSVGNSLASHIMAILESSDRPLHFQEISTKYEEIYGVSISTRYVHACLGHNQFLLFDRGTYGVPKHLKLSQVSQDLIRDKIEAVILAGPESKQWHVSDFAKKFSLEGADPQLDKFIINIILRSSKKLTYLGKMLWKIKSNGDQNTQRVHIRRAAYEALLNAGHALHTERLQDIISESRGLDSIFNLQPNELYSRVDPSTWGLLERDFVLSLPEQKNVRDNFFAFFQKSGSSLHRSELLKQQIFSNPPPQLTENQVLGILTSDPRFKPWHGGFVGLAAWNESGRKTVSTVLREIAETVTDTIHTDEIVFRAQALLGFEFKNAAISIHLNKYGLSYDKDIGLWKKLR